jgi:hypothetical protein
VAEVDRPPVAKYRLDIEVTGNTLEEVFHELHVAVNDAEFESLRTDTIDRISGRHTLTLAKPNPEMTPDRYADELETWVDRRRQKSA